MEKRGRVSLITETTAKANDGEWLGRGPSMGALRFTGALLIILLLGGCGYSFLGGGASTYPKIRSVYVDAFANRTAEANIDIIFRNAFSTLIAQYGDFKLAASPGEADGIIRGSILNLQAAPLAYKSSTFSAEDRITVILEIFFDDRGSGRILWSNTSFVSTVEYPVTSVGVTEASRTNALNKLASDTAEKAYRLMMSDF